MGIFLGSDTKTFVNDRGERDWNTVFSTLQSDLEWISCPTHQMVLKWLREVHRFIVTIDYDRYPVSNEENDIVGYGYNIQTKDNPEDYYRISESVYNSYEEAIEAAIKYCLENLI